MFDRAKLKLDAKRKIKGRVFPVFLGLFVWIIATSLIATNASRKEGVIIIFDIIAFLLSVLEIGAMKYMLNFVDNDKTDYNLLFISFKSGNTYIKHLGLIFLRGLFVFLWLLLLIIPGIIKALAYSQASYIMAENPDKDIMDCLRESEKLMVGHKGEFFVLVLSFIGWGLFVAITFGIGIIYVSPYFNTTLAMYHRWLKPLPAVEILDENEQFFAGFDN